MANTHTLLWKYKPPFELPENSAQRLHKAPYRLADWLGQAEVYIFQNTAFPEYA